MFETIKYRSLKYEHAPCRRFSYFESGTQASDMLDMLKFHKISITKWSLRKLRGFSGSN